MQKLRYGENPHQEACLYSFKRGEGPLGGETLQGKELSYNNLLDLDAAWRTAVSFERPTVAIIKHANPCGVALGATLAEAYSKALVTDPVSAFGGIVAANRALDAEAAREIVKIFTEVIIAPDATAEAKAILADKKNLRLLLAGGLPDPRAEGLTFRSLAGGFLVQGRDNGVVSEPDLKVVTRRKPSREELADLLFAFTVAKHVKSNAIVYARDGGTVGIGAGQMSRVYSTRIAEVESPGTPSEREKPIGNDSGYLWRLNTYWRYLERDGGVYIQMESISLSRDIPAILAWLVRPFVEGVPRAVTGQAGCPPYSPQPTPPSKAAGAACGRS